MAGAAGSPSPRALAGAQPGERANHALVGCTLMTSASRPHAASRLQVIDHDPEVSTRAYFATWASLRVCSTTPLPDGHFGGTAADLGWPVLRSLMMMFFCTSWSQVQWRLDRTPIRTDRLANAGGEWLPRHCSRCVDATGSSTRRASPRACGARGGRLLPACRAERATLARDRAEPRAAAGERARQARGRERSRVRPCRAP